MDFIEILKVIFLGIVEGITEWLPVSSTGHMLLVDALFTLNAEKSFKEMFFVVIQLGAILAVVVLFWNKLFPVKRNEETKKLGWDKGILNLWGKVLVACVPAGIIGILFDDLLEQYLHTPLIISIMLIAYGIAFILVERYNKGKTLPLQSTDEITYKHALIIGVFQVLSLIFPIKLGNVIAATTPIIVNESNISAIVNAKKAAKPRLETLATQAFPTFLLLIITSSNK